MMGEIVKRQPYLDSHESCVKVAIDRQSLSPGPSSPSRTSELMKMKISC